MKIPEGMKFGGVTMVPSSDRSVTLKIKSADDLRALEKDARTRRRRAKAVALELPGMKAEDQRRAERRINKAYFACGCAEATVLGLVGLAASIGWLVLQKGGVAALPWTSWLLPLVVFVAATGIGKWLGLVRARFALRREVENLIAASGLRMEPPDGAGAKAMCAVH